MNSKRLFGMIGDREIHAYALQCGRMEAEVLDYGAIIRRLSFKGRDIVFGFDDLESYIKTNDYHGAVVGRVANRIKGGRFMLGGREVILDRNDGNNHLHGGIKGLDKAIWRSFGTDKYISLEKSSEDGDQKYPGNVEVTVNYFLQFNRLLCVIEAETDEDTVFGPTLHCYYNLAGVNSGEDILNHKLTLYCDKYNEVDDELIPVGEAAVVAGTPFDFRDGRLIGERIGEDNQQLKYGSGYDHNYHIRKDIESSIEISGMTCYRAATAEYSDMTMDLYTSQPCMQFYSGNFMNKPYKFSGGADQRPRLGFCLEPQFVPNSPNLPNCGRTLLKKNKLFRYMQVLEFR
ncbi:MAG: galactose mutarotase [Eubacteriales bacterium]|nr:galactose mutarotase [Eubacteriales bacterium]MDD4475960.1 galactose mutarotase [Eubacteriales bacterium]